MMNCTCNTPYCHSPKKMKTGDNTLLDFMNTISESCENIVLQRTKLKKCTEAELTFPTTNNFSTLTEYSYNLQQLKSYCKHYKLKVSGTKDQLLSRLYTHLRLSYFIIKIQRCFRNSLEKRLQELRGPPPNMCTNFTDFMTLDELSSLSYDQFFSFEDSDGFIYGFDLRSIYQLVIKQDKNQEISNPYNRNKLPCHVVRRIRRVVTLSKLLKKNVVLEIEDDNEGMTEEQVLELRTLSLFQEMDALGNYTNYMWFHSLNKIRVIKLIRELTDIFNFRAQLTHETKCNICPPHGDPFRHLSISFLITSDNIIKIRTVVLEVLEKFIFSGVNTDSRALGAYYVLGALTLVNEDAAMCLPWLYQSVSPF